MIYIELYGSFLLIGFTSFGGMSMIPLINAEMLSHGWMTATAVSDIVAIAEMTPSPPWASTAPPLPARGWRASPARCAQAWACWPRR